MSTNIVLASKKPGCLTLFSVALLAATFLVPSQARPVAADDPPSLEGIDRYTVVLAKKAITVSGDEIDNAVIVVLDGKIENIGKGLEYPKNANVIDAGDRVVMPGLINPLARGNLPAFSRSGVHTNLVAADELFTTDETFSTQVEYGFTTIGLVPSGSGLPGRLSIVHTAGDEDSQIVKRESLIYATGNKGEIRAALERAQKEIDKVEAARKKWEEAQKKGGKPESSPEGKGDETPSPEPTPEPEPEPEPETAPGAWGTPLPPRRPTPTPVPTPSPASQPVTPPATTAFSPPKIAEEYQPLVDLIQKKEGVALFVRLNDASDYIHLLEVFQKFDVARVFYLQTFSTSDFHEVAKKMGENKEKVLMTPYWNTLPHSAERYLLAAELAAAGCAISLQPSNEGEYAHRNLFAQMSELVSMGFSRELALQAVTVAPAKLLLIDQECGTLEKERAADMIMLDGDPLAPGTRVTGVMIGGDMVWERKENPND
ncbi:MAG: amidohydrolase family protein [Phycisphaerae bacterium]